MGIEFNHCLGASIYGEELKESLFSKIDGWMSSKNKFLPIILAAAAFPIGVGLSLVTLATKIAVVAEISFKACANIALGLKGIEGFNAKLGAKQLFLALPASIIDLIVGAPVHMTYNTIVDSSGIALNAVGKATKTNTVGKMISQINYVEETKKWHTTKTEQLEAVKRVGSAVDYLDLLSAEIEEFNASFKWLEKNVLPSVALVSVIGNSIIYGEFLPKNLSN